MGFLANLLAALVGVAAGAAGATYKIQRSRQREASPSDHTLFEQTKAMQALEEQLARVASYSEAAAAERARAIEEERIDPETLAVITAAVAVCLNKRVRIKSVELAQPGKTWSHQGRLGVQSSHNLRSRR